MHSQFWGTEKIENPKWGESDIDYVKSNKFILQPIHSKLKLSCKKHQYCFLKIPSLLLTKRVYKVLKKQLFKKVVA